MTADFGSTARPIGSLDPAMIRERLAAVRARTLELVAPLDWPTLRRQHVPILSPMVWDLGHIGHFEELWLVQKLGALAPLADGFDRLFDAVRNPRPTRESLPLPDRDELRRYLERVRRRTEEVLAECRRAEDGARERRDLLADGFVYEMIAEHEEQHQETLLQAMQVLESPPYSPTERRPTAAAAPAARALAGTMVTVSAGPFQMGAAAGGFSYDNERRRHRVVLDEFSIDVAPVTNGQFLAFVEGGGYERPEHWSAAGRAWLAESGARAPANWRAGDGGWQVRYMDQVLDLPAHRPVVHVCYFEAEAFARWAGKRLPTEEEWEKAALWDPVAERPRPYPWGDETPTEAHANLDQRAFAPAEAGAYPDGASAYGLHQTLGDVWEWTASDFVAYPGFRAFPYAEYSEIFFGREYKVLRGGSWATRPAVARGTFRNWDLPIRRQIFAGFRCAA